MHIKRDIFTGEVVEESSSGEARTVIARIEYRGAVEKGGISPISGWPIVSEAMAINPEDIPRAQAILAERGIKTHYDKSGRPVLESRAHRKAHAQCMGFYDLDGGYSDPQPQNL